MKKTVFTIQRLMIVFGIIIIGLLTFLGLQTYNSISDIRIGSANYTRVIMGKDLIADILPPPLYPAEAFAYMHLLEDEPELLSRLNARIDRIEADYKKRMAFWRENIATLNIMSPEAWTEFSTEIDRRNNEFWSDFRTQIIPAFQRHDLAAIDTISKRMSHAFISMGEYMSAKADEIAKSSAAIEQASIDESNLDINLMTGFNIAIALIVTLMLLAAHQFVIRAITSISATMGRLAGGQLDEDVPYATRGDEMGDMARALAVFKDQAVQNRRNDENSKHIITVLGQGLENLAKGNLTHRIDQPFPDTLDRLRQYFNSAADSLADTINSVKRGSFGIKSGTEEIAQASDNLSRRTEN